MSRIVMDGAGLTFRVRQHTRMGLKEYLVKQMFRRSINPILEVKALSGLDLTVERGDRVGVIGHNGAGKSTLLRMLAGVYKPSHGLLTVDGRISALFDLTLGFEQDATGWDNIAYRSYLQGETPKTVRTKRAAIAEFSELGGFLNTPVRYYSSGMMVRLGFSIATTIEPEILLVDEVLSAGDMSFQEKARERMRTMMDRAHLIVMVSHDLVSLAKICNRAIWLDHGHMMMAGPTEQVIAAYTESATGGQAKAAA